MKEVAARVAAVDGQRRAWGLEQTVEADAALGMPLGSC
jgi:hypothetical protein